MCAERMVVRDGGFLPSARVVVEGRGAVGVLVRSDEVVDARRNTVEPPPGTADD